MAYHDKDGRITIDEEAANRDIKKLHHAAGNIRTSMEQIQRMMEEASNGSEEYSRAIYQKNMQLYRHLKDVKEELMETADYIERVVKSYKRKDEELKKVIAENEIDKVRSSTTSIIGTLKKL